MGALVLQGTGGDAVMAVREAGSNISAGPSRGAVGSPGAGLGSGLFQLSPGSPRASAWALGSRPHGLVCCLRPERCPPPPALTRGAGRAPGSVSCLCPEASSALTQGMRRPTVPAGDGGEGDGEVTGMQTQASSGHRGQEFSSSGSRPALGRAMCHPSGGCSLRSWRVPGQPPQ